MKRTRLAGTLLLGLLILLAILPSLTVQADFGSNWSATFFPSVDFSGSGVAVSGISAINFNWGSGTPIVNGVAVPGIAADNFSARFTSTQNLAPGTYQFVAQSDDGVRISVNGSLIINNFTPHAVTTDTAVVSITSTPVNITVEYFEGIDQAVIQVQWFLQSATGTQPFGFTPTPIVTAAPAITVSVASVRGLALRSGPYLGASLISVVRQGTEYIPTARNKDEGIYTWYLIKVGDSVGWSSSRYLAITGDPNFPPVQGSVFDQIDGVPDLGVKGITRSVMNMRRRPSIRTALLDQIPWGAEVSIVGRTIQDGKNFWYQIHYNNKIGWIYAPYVTIHGDINAVPIR